MRIIALALVGLLAAATPALVGAGDPCAAPTLVARGEVPTIGTDGNDVILGTEGDDVIEAGAGDDVVCSGGGDDKLNGGEGSDRLLGGKGDDLLAGDRGGDLLRGGPGRDVLDAGPADDVEAVDRCAGGTGRDEEAGAGGCDDLVSIEAPPASSVGPVGDADPCADEPAVTYFPGGSVTYLVSCGDDYAEFEHFDSAERLGEVEVPPDFVPEDDAHLDPNP